MAFLHKHPIFSISHFSEIEFLQKELQKWSSIQKTINNSQQEEEDCVCQKTLNSDVPYLWMYHVLIDDKLCAELTKAFTVKTRQELDGCNSGIYKSYYNVAPEKFNYFNWVSSSPLLLEPHDAYAESKMLVLQNCSKKLADEQYKMVKIIADWENLEVDVGK